MAQKYVDEPLTAQEKVAFLDEPIISTTQRGTDTSGMAGFGNAMLASRPDLTATPSELKAGMLRAAPTLGATALGLAAAPFTGGMSLPMAAGLSAALAGGGAGLGLAVKQYGEGNQAKLERPTVSGNVEEMIAQGTLGMLGEGTGRFITRGLKAAAPRLYKHAVNPNETLRNRYRNWVQTGLEQAAPIGSSGRVMENMAKSKAGSEAMVARAIAAGAPDIPLNDLTQPVADLLGKGVNAAKRGRGWGEYQDVADRIEALRSMNPAGISLSESAILKPGADAAATAAQNAFGRGLTPQLSAEIEDAVRAGIQQGQQGSVEQVLSEVPTLAARNRQTRDLYGLGKILSRAENRPAGGVLSSGLGLFSPTAQSAYGVGAHLASQMPISTILKALTPTMRAALLAQLQGQQTP